MGLKISVIVVLILGTYITFWNNTIQSNKDNIIGIKVCRLFPIVGNDGKLKKYEPNEIEIYFSRDQVLYKNPYVFLTHSLNGGIVKSEKRVNYFAYTKGNKYGHFTDSSLSVFDNKVLIDSVIGKQWYTSEILGSIFTKYSVRIISSKKTENLRNLDEKYSFKGKVDSTQTGTIFLSFTTALKDIDYSLSREMDSIKNMKLYKIKIVNDSRYLKDYNIIVDKVEQNREIESIPVSNRSEILAFFERDKKHNSQH